MDKLSIFGTAGSSIILIAYFLNQAKKLSTEDFLYDFLNLMGGSILLTYAILLPSIPFAILNGVWTLVALKDVISYLINKKTAI